MVAQGIANSTKRSSFFPQKVCYKSTYLTYLCNISNVNHIINASWIPKHGSCVRGWCARSIACATIDYSGWHVGCFCSLALVVVYTVCCVLYRCGHSPVSNILTGEKLGKKWRILTGETLTKKLYFICQSRIS